MGSEKISLWEIEISPDGTHHIYRGKPLYKKRFLHVMSYHPPGVAPVQDETGAYHIDLNGNPIYHERYLKTYGYYEGIATVVDEDGYTHIDLKGRPVHGKHYAWAGNFQNGRCVVRDWDGSYYHIGRDGEPAYPERYAYAGDYRHGVAVVYDHNGYAYHIDKYGRRIHGGIFHELYPYHKGAAVARDNRGYFHIDMEGRPLYDRRFRLVEDYYNDNALAWTVDGRMMIIDRKGRIVHEVTGYSAEVVRETVKGSIMKMMIGYWYTQIIYSIARLGLIDAITDGYDTPEKLGEHLGVPYKCLKMIIDFMRVYGLVELVGDKLKVTPPGLLLSDIPEDTLKYAALMWGEEHYIAMSRLHRALLKCGEGFSEVYGKPFYDYLRSNPGKAELFVRAMKAYTLDYDPLVGEMKIPEWVESIIDVGGGSGDLLLKIKGQYPSIKEAILFDLPEIAEKNKRLLDKGIRIVGGDFLDEIPLTGMDAAVVSRVLHDWPDRAVHRILCNVNRALGIGGLLYIFELLYPENPEYDLGVSLNFDLLVMLGGRERTLGEFDELLKGAGFSIMRVVKGDIISLIIAVKERKCGLSED